ncbi:MAG TPA: four helix bundle protein [Thermoanaerobaculia bacterium]
MTELPSVEKSLRFEVRGSNEEVRNGIDERVFNFACRVMRMDRALGRKANRNAMNQLVRSATSIGANLEEARGAHSKADFHSKVRIALKESREAHYWLRLIAAFSNDKRVAPLINEANEFVAILTTIAKKTNPNLLTS